VAAALWLLLVAAHPPPPYAWLPANSSQRSNGMESNRIYGVLITDSWLVRRILNCGFSMDRSICLLGLPSCVLYIERGEEKREGASS
jgi:hypothetical protein